MRLSHRAFPLRRLLAHAGLALALLLAQLGMLGHAYTAHPLQAETAQSAAGKQAPAHGSDARDVCSICLAYSVFSGSLPASYHFDAPFLPRIAYAAPHAHGSPQYPFLSYASRAPPSLRA